jgi:hypothetical protein
VVRQMFQTAWCGYTLTQSNTKNIVFLTCHFNLHHEALYNKFSGCSIHVVPLPVTSLINDKTSSVLDIYNNKTSVLIRCVYTRNASKHHKCYKRTNYVEHPLSNKGVDVYGIR